MPVVDKKKKTSEKKSSAPTLAPSPFPEGEKAGFFIARGDDAITAEQGKALLGWETEEGDGKGEFEHALPILDVHGKRFRCMKNLKNRRLTPGKVSALKQEQLNQNWEYNGEPIIIGDEGNVLNGQHTLIALVLADQEIKDGKNSAQWKKIWKTDISIDKLIIFGVSEADKVVNTLDTCNPRTLEDVLYRSAYFSSLTPNARHQATLILGKALKLLWDRIGLSVDKEAPLRTHAEALDFLDRHEHILAAVKHIIEENEKNAIGKFIHPGVAAACLFLMGSSDSSREKWEASPNDLSLEWGLWERASEFFVGLGGGSRDFNEVRTALGAILDPLKGNNTLAERLSVLCKAWGQFAAGEKIKPSDVALEYHTDAESGERKFLNDPVPTFGGIDIGDPSELDTEEAPSEEEIAKQAKATKEKNLKAKAGETEEGSLEANIEDLRQKYPKTLLLLRTKKGDFNSFGEDAVTLGAMEGLGGKLGEKEGIPQYVLPKKSYAGLHEKLKAMKKKAGVISEVDGVREFAPIK